MNREKRKGRGRAWGGNILFPGLSYKLYRIFLCGRVLAEEKGKTVACGSRCGGRTEPGLAYVLCSESITGCGPGGKRGLEGHNQQGGRSLWRARWIRYREK